MIVQSLLDFKPNQVLYMENNSCMLEVGDQAPNGAETNPVELFPHLFAQISYSCSKLEYWELEQLSKNITAIFNKAQKRPPWYRFFATLLNDLTYFSAQKCKQILLSIIKKQQSTLLKTKYKGKYFELLFARMNIEENKVRGLLCDRYRILMLNDRSHLSALLRVKKDGVIKFHIYPSCPWPIPGKVLKSSEIRTALTFSARLIHPRIERNSNNTESPDIQILASWKHKLVVLNEYPFAFQSSLSFWYTDTWQHFNLETAALIPCQQRDHQYMVWKSALLDYAKSRPFYIIPLALLAGTTNLQGMLEHKGYTIETIPLHT